VLGELQRRLYAGLESLKCGDNQVRWWQSDGLERYRRAIEMLVLADSGGSNAASSQSPAFRHQSLL
jgi:hypothetical protein